MGVLEEDFQRIADDPNMNLLQNSSVLITGATGLVGSVLLRALSYADQKNQLHLTLYPVIRDQNKLENILGGAPAEDMHPIQADVTAEDFVETVKQNIDPEKPLYIFHAAAVTKSKTMVERPVETIETALKGTRNLLETAKNLNAASMVYLSSMEVYGNMAVYGDSTRADETRLGFLDLSKVRTDYPESKRMCENLCTAYASEYGVHVKTARLAQTFGAGILPWESRVFAQFAKSAMEGTDIVLHTKGLSEGNYCYTADCARGLLAILLKGKDGESYNVANEKTHTTIGGMAEMVANEIAGGKIQVVFDIPETNTFGYAADTKLTLDSTKLQSLGWQPEVDLPDMYRRMIRYLQETQKDA